MNLEYINTEELEYYKVGESGIKIIIDRTTEEKIYMVDLSDCSPEEEDMYWVEGRMHSSTDIQDLKDEIKPYLMKQIKWYNELAYHSNDIINRYIRSL